VPVVAKSHANAFPTKSRFTPTASTVPLVPKNSNPKLFYIMWRYRVSLAAGATQSCPITTLCTRASPNSRATFKPDTFLQETFATTIPTTLLAVQGISFFSVCGICLLSNPTILISHHPIV